MISKRSFWRATALACTLAGCQNLPVPTAPEPSRLSPPKQEAATGTDATSPISDARLGMLPITPSQTADTRTPVDAPPVDATPPAATVPAVTPPETEGEATESPALDAPSLEPEFVSPSEVAASRTVAMHVNPSWYQQPIPGQYGGQFGGQLGGQLGSQIGGPGQPVGMPFPVPANQANVPNPVNWQAGQWPGGTWDDAPIPGSAIGLDNPATWTGNPSGLSFGADPRLFGELPTEIPAPLANNTLYPIDHNQISAGFAPDEFRGLPGTYMGFAPGFGMNLLARCRYLYAGGVLVPFILIGNRYVPVVFVSPRHRMFVYPSLIYVGGTLVPIYHSAPHLFGPYSHAFPINFGSTFTSPLDLLQVSGPAMVRPIILRKHNRFADTEIFAKVRTLRGLRPRVGLAKHKIDVVRKHVKVRQRVKGGKKHRWF